MHGASHMSGFEEEEQIGRRSSFYISAENSCTSPCKSALNTTEPQIFGSFEDKL
jgi:hypothetical protein